MKQPHEINILVGCEESQAVTKAFRKLGFNAFSCDIKDCTGGHHEWHIKGCAIEAMDSKEWDLFIGHPPCTYISFAGNRWFNVDKYGQKALDRINNRNEAIEFFLKMWNSTIKHICIENPKGYIQNIVPYSQLIQPYYFGDSCSKTTLLWIKNLPLLYHNKFSNLFDENITHVFKGEMTPSGSKELFGAHTLSMTKEERSTLRSKTFPGIAKAMAEQWGNYLLSLTNEELTIKI